jgi:hypothetical protein
VALGVWIANALETVQNLGAYWPSVRPEDRESGMIRDRDARLALFSPQVLDGLMEKYGIS